MTDPLAQLEEERKQAMCDQSAREASRFLDSLMAGGFSREEAVRIIVAWQGRPIGMSVEQMGEMIASMFTAIDKAAQ